MFIKIINFLNYLLNYLLLNNIIIFYNRMANYGLTMPESNLIDFKFIYYIIFTNNFIKIEQFHI